MCRSRWEVRPLERGEVRGMLKLAAPRPRLAPVRDGSFYRSDRSIVLVVERQAVPERRAEREAWLLERLSSRPELAASPVVKAVVLEQVGATDETLEVLPEIGYFVGASGRIEWGKPCGNALAAASVYLAESFGVERRVRFLHPAQGLVAEGWARRGDEGQGSFRVWLRFRPAGLAQDKPDWCLEGSTPVDLDFEAGPRPFLLDVANPYLLLDAASLGLADPLAAAGNEELWPCLAEVWRRAQVRFGLPPQSVFPKVALVARTPAGFQAAMFTRPECWHPSFALTGLVNLAVAAARARGPLAQPGVEEGAWPARLKVETPARFFTLEIGPADGLGARRLPEWIDLEQRVLSES